MARSLSRVDAGNVIPGPVFLHEPSSSYFTVESRDGKGFQRRHQLGFDRQPTNILEKEIHYVMGSGRHVRTYLHRTAENKLIEMVIREDPRHAEAYQVLGDLLAQAGQPKVAIERFREALRLRPDFARAMIGLAPLLVRRVTAMARLRFWRRPQPCAATAPVIKADLL